MKPENIKLAFERISPDKCAKRRMLENVLNYFKKGKVTIMLNFNFKKAIPALALAVVITGGIFTYSLKDKLFGQDFQSNSRPNVTQGDMIGEKSAPGMEDMAAPLLNQFQIDGRHYILTSDYAEEFGFPVTISEKDIGPKITTIEKSPDESLIGCEVFSYLPAGCEAVVAVKRNDKYELFKFYTFESYINNQDEDAIEYLKLYGIEGPEDIARIQFIVHTEKSRLEELTNIKSEITDRNEITNFYNFYSALKNSSDKYFEKLFGYNGQGSGRNVEIDVAYPVEGEGRTPSQGKSVDPIPPDYVPALDYEGDANETVKAYPNDKGIAKDLPLETRAEPASTVTNAGNSSSNVTSQGMMDMGGTGPAQVAPSQGSVGNALSDPVTIRIYNQNGVYFESMYYRNIGFISRYELPAEFSAFIENYIK